MSQYLAGVPVSFARGQCTTDSCHFTQDSISHNALHGLINCINCLSSDLNIRSQLSHIRMTLKVEHTLTVFAGDWIFIVSVSPWLCGLILRLLPCIWLIAACPDHCLSCGLFFCFALDYTVRPCIFLTMFINKALHLDPLFQASSNLAPSCSDGEVKRSETMMLSTQLYRENVHYSELFKTVHALAILWSWKWTMPSKGLWFITAAGFTSGSTTDSLF